MLSSSRLFFRNIRCTCQKTKWGPSFIQQHSRRRLNTVGTPKKKYELPPTLLIYDNGTARNNLIAAIKLTVIIAAFCNIGYKLVAEFHKDDGPDTWTCMKITSISLVPPIIMILLTHPYVATISLLLPQSARVSRATLQSYIKNLNGDAIVVLTRVNAMGLPGRREMVQVDNLLPVKQRWGDVANYATIKGANSSIGYGSRFYIGNLPRAEKLSREPGVWTQIAGLIEQDAQRLRRRRNES